MTCVERLRAHGILRQGTPRSGFRYAYASGGRPPAREVRRIRALRLPPAWRDVAIDRSPQARVQAVGRDAAGRWQYVYHPRHVLQRERRKRRRLLQFGTALPRLRRAIALHMRTSGLGRDKVLATMVRILASAFIRPGSEAYAAENGSYGIATLRRRHVRVHGDTIAFDFPAKSSKRQQHMLRDRAVARIVRQLLQLPGYEVFKYRAEDERIIDLRRADITAYIKEHMGDGFTAKDFRTWAATLVCACALARAATTVEDGVRARRRAVAAALRATAEQLGNTPAICRSAYVSPAVLTAFERGTVVGAYCDDVRALVAGNRRATRAAERALLRFLRNGDAQRASPLRRAA
jgi:DNA topoisomerase-1